MRYAGNKAQLEALLATMRQLVENVSDPASQKASLNFFGRLVTVWAQPAINGDAQTQSLPGFERFVYEAVIPTAFAVLSSPQFNIKDGQMLTVR